jgi:SNF family Na+-dependent transporter
MPNNAKVAQIYVELQANIAKFKAAMGEATSATKQFAAQTRADMKQSQDSVRLLSEEMGLGIPRSLQRVISTLPGVSTAMNLAFDGVVVFALIATVVKVTEKVVEFAKKSSDAARKNAEAWQSIQGSMQVTNDELQVTNDKIENAIAKLENKPQNG